MSINITYSNGYTLADVRSVSLHGLPGIGGYTLSIILDLSIHPPKTDVWLNNISIRIDWGDKSQRMIGNATPEESQPIRISQYDKDKTISFKLLLMPNQIEAIESLRNGGDFSVTIWFTCNVIHNEATSNIQQQGVFIIPQKEWIDALERMGYRSTFLFELPIPFIGDNKIPASQIIQKAQAHLLRGHYDDCVGECRKLLEAYALSEADQKLLKAARDKYKGNQTTRESMDIHERMLVAREALTHATHPAHHHSNDDYSRDQARAILGSAISILSIFANDI